MGVNHLGHMLLAAELTGLLRRNPTPARVVSVTSSAALDAAPRFFDDLGWQKNKYDRRQAYCVSKACNVLFADHLAVREGGRVLAAAVDPGPTVTQIVRYELPQRAQQRQGMSTEQLARQAKQLGYRTPDQAGDMVASLLGERAAPEFTSGGLYLGVLSPPGKPGPLITEPIPWRTPARAAKVWENSA